MAGVTWHRLSSPEEWLEALDRSTAESMALLDRNNQAEEARRAKTRLSLDSAVAGLSVEGAPLDLTDLRTDAPRGGVMASPRSFVPMPRRSTHGGPFGPAVRQKLVDEAMGRRRW